MHLACSCIVPGDLWRVSVLSVAVVIGSAVALTQLCVVSGNYWLTGTDFLLCMEINVKLYAVLALLSLYEFCQVLVCADWLLLCGCYMVVYVLTSVVVCFGVMDTCGCLRTGGWAGRLWLLGFQKSVKDLVGEDRWVVLYLDLFQELVLTYWGEFCKARHSKCSEKWCNCFLWCCQYCG